MTLAVVNNDPVLRHWRLPFAGMAISALLHAAMWTAWLMRDPKPEPVPTPPQVIEVSLIAAQPQSTPPPPQVALKPPPPKTEKAPEKPAPRKPEKPKPAPKKLVSPVPPKQDVPAAPEAPAVQEAHAAEAPPAPAADKVPGPTPAAVMKASYKKKCLPTRYPPVATARGWEGKVDLLVQVLPDGTVGEVRVEHSSGHEILDDSAVEQIRKDCSFNPELRGKQAVVGWANVPFVFKLKH